VYWSVSLATFSLRAAAAVTILKVEPGSKLEEITAFLHKESG
jgi:hypothetical protein